MFLATNSGTAEQYFMSSEMKRKKLFCQRQNFFSGYFPWGLFIEHSSFGIILLKD